MSTGAEERPLAGGRSTRVARVGDTLRREAGPWTRIESRARLSDHHD